MTVYSLLATIHLLLAAIHLIFSAICQKIVDLKLHDGSLCLLLHC